MNRDDAGFFKGTELARMLVLLGVALGGWAWLWTASRAPAPLDEAPAMATGQPEPIVPDASGAFESVTDKTPLGLLDTAAYAELLERARDLSAEALAAKARRDVGFSHLWDRPEHYRGVPVHLLGTVRRVIRYDSKLARGGWLYEAWVFSTESQNHPYVCVFEEVPTGLPIGNDLSERVVFNGYFLKLMKYQAGDASRAAPLLVGKIGWTPRAGGPGWSIRSTAWAAGIMAALFTISLVRWVFRLRRTFSQRGRPPIRFDRPSESIDPDALAEWAEKTAEESDRLDDLRRSPDESA